MMSNNWPDLSIVICTYNRARLLQDCLWSLVNQTADITQIPVIVIDNNSTDTTAEVIRAFEGQVPGIKYIFEAEQGLSHARNRGFREAGTEWVAYLDDDARAFPDYLENLKRAIRESKFDCIGGVYLPWYKSGRPKWYLDSYCANAGMPEGLLKDDFASGGNLIIKRAVLERFDGFSSMLGMSGKRIAYGEETRLQVMMRREGLTIGFDPEIRIKHLVASYKLTPRWFMRESFAKGKGSWDTFLYDRTLKRMGKETLMGLVQFLEQAISGLWRLASRRNYYVQNWLIDCTRPIAFSLGAAIGFFQQVTSRDAVQK